MSLETSTVLDRLSCPSCGAGLPSPLPGEREIECSFCGSLAVLFPAEENLTSAAVVLFAASKVTREEFEEAAQHWLIHGETTPNDLVEKMEMQDRRLFYVPMILFEGSYSATWNASSGYHREENFTEWDEYQKRNVRRTRKVTDWTPSSGKASGQFTTFAWAGFPEEIPTDLATFLEKCIPQRSELRTPAREDFLSCGLPALMIDSDEVWANRKVMNRVTEMAGDRAELMVPGDTHQHLRWNTSATIRDTTTVHIPIWLMSFSYHGESFWFAMDAVKSEQIWEKPPIASGKVLRFGFYSFLSILAICTWLSITAWALFSEDSLGQPEWVFAAGAIPVYLVFSTLKWAKNFETSRAAKRRHWDLIQKMQN